MVETEPPLYSSRIIKAGALLSDTKTLLARWDLRASILDNLDRIHHENLFGKASRSRVEDILAIFRQRYLTEISVIGALSTLVSRKISSASLDRILYFHSARADRLLHDVVTKVLLPRNARGLMDLEPREVEKVLAEWVAAGKTVGHWSMPTIGRISRGILSALRDFGVLQGAVKKRIAPAYLPIEAFCYVAFFLKEHQPSGAKLLESPEWRLFFLPREGVERSLFEAHQMNLLEYHAAGTVTRLTFPVSSLEEYAHVLAYRAS